MKNWLSALLLTLVWSVTNALPSTPLPLDFTFPTAALVEDVGKLKGIAVHPSGDSAVLLNNSQTLIFLDLGGEIRDQDVLPISANLTGVSWLSEDVLLLSTRSGRLFHYEPMTGVVYPAGRLPRRGAVQAVAYSSENDTTYAISNRGRATLLQVNSDGKRSLAKLDRRLNQSHQKPESHLSRCNRLAITANKCHVKIAKRRSQPCQT